MKKLKVKKYALILSGIAIIAFISTFAYFKYTLDKPSIILITIDTLRADHLSGYGYGRNTSPNIDRLAKEGVMFTQAVSAGGWTAESVPSILTGTSSLTHGIRGWGFRRNPSIKTLPQLLKSKNNKSALFTNHQPIGTLDILDSFDPTYIMSHRLMNELNLTLKAIDWIKENKNVPFFMWLHYHGAHPPYRPPEPYKSKYLYDRFRVKKEIPISKDKFDKWNGDGKIPYAVVENNISDVGYYIAQYDGTISYIDAQIGLLIDNLKQSGLLEDTLIVLTADHGELLGEHNIYFGCATGYEGNIRVPLIIRFPKLFPEGGIISQQVSLLDIAPTVLEVAGLDKPSYMQGESLLAFIKPSRTYNSKYAFSCDRNQFTLRSEDWKLLYWGEKKWGLYNLKKDPKEQDNLLFKRKDKFKQLRQELENWKKRVTSPIPAKKGPPLTEEDKKCLRSLGYLQ